MRKEATVQRPDVTVQLKKGKLIQIIDTACPSDQNINKKVKEKFQKYQQLAYKETRGTLLRSSQQSLDAWEEVQIS